MNRRRHQSARVDGDQPKRVTDPESRQFGSLGNQRDRIDHHRCPQNRAHAPQRARPELPERVLPRPVTHVVRGLRPRTSAPPPRCRRSWRPDNRLWRLWIRRHSRDRPPRWASPSGALSASPYAARSQIRRHRPPPVVTERPRTVSGPTDGAVGGGNRRPSDPPIRRLEVDGVSVIPIVSAIRSATHRRGHRV